MAAQQYIRKCILHTIRSLGSLIRSAILLLSHSLKVLTFTNLYVQVIFAHAIPQSMSVHGSKSLFSLTVIVYEIAHFTTFLSFYRLGKLSTDCD